MPVPNYAQIAQQGQRSVSGSMPQVYDFATGGYKPVVGYNPARDGGGAAGMSAYTARLRASMGLPPLPPRENGNPVRYQLPGGNLTTQPQFQGQQLPRYTGSVTPQQPSGTTPSLNEPNLNTPIKWDMGWTSTPPAGSLTATQLASLQQPPTGSGTPGTPLGYGGSAQPNGGVLNALGLSPRRNKLAR